MKSYNILTTLLISQKWRAADIFGAIYNANYNAANTKCEHSYRTDDDSNRRSDAT